MIDLFAYHSPLEYLHAVMALEKAERTDFSLDKFSAALGLSRSALSMILSGKRSITNTLIHSIARELKLSETEHEQWETLIHFFQSNNELDRVWYQRKLRQSKSDRKVTAIRTPTTNLVSAWYVPAILVFLIDLAESSGVEVVQEIAGKLALPEDAVRKVLEKLQNDGFLQFKGRGNVHVSFDRISASVSSKKFLKDVLLEAARRMDTEFDQRESFFTSHTFSIEKKSIPVFIQDYNSDYALKKLAGKTIYFKAFSGEQIDLFWI